MKKLIAVALRILISSVFLVSAYLKLFPVEPFELTFIETGIGNWSTAPFIARILIGIEFLLGALILTGIALKRFTLPASIILILVFSAYLIGLLIISGNKGDCGCFGIYFPMTPLQSILKNATLLILLIVLWRICGDKKIPLQSPIMIGIAILALALPFVVNPLDRLNQKNLQPETVNFALPQELIGENKFGQPSINLFEGKHIVSFMTLTCSHCRQAALKFHVIQKRNPDISFFIFLNGKDELLDDFFTATKSEDIPHIKMNAEPFSKLTRGVWPQIWWIEDGIVKRKSFYYSFNEDDLLEWWNTP